MKTSYPLALLAGLVACDAPGRHDDAARDAAPGPQVSDAASEPSGFVDARPVDHPDAAIGTDPEPDPDDCGRLTAILRDFSRQHPDFESGLGDDRGFVGAALDASGRPVYAAAGATATVSGAASFDEWYRDVPGVNLRFEEELPLTEVAPGTFVFDDTEFFPLDGRGFPGEDVIGHNFHFTTEIHATFHYRGGELFTFRGDDDVFVFVNGRLALDLGGVHGPQEGTIDFDARAAELGIVPGQACTLDVFHAERHTSMSNFRIETTIDCLVVE